MLCVHTEGGCRYGEERVGFPMRWIRRRMTYANIAASCAVFLALGGGAYAVGDPSSVADNGSVPVCGQLSQEISAAVMGTGCPSGGVAMTRNQNSHAGQPGRRGRTGAKSGTDPTGVAGAAGAAGASDFYLAQAGRAHAAAGTSYVAGNGSVSVCVQPNQEMSAAVTGTQCPAGWWPITLNQQGQAGDRGMRGRTGAIPARRVRRA